MDLLDLILRWAHILSAIALLGGAVFLRLVLVPSLARVDDAARDAVNGEVRARCDLLEDSADFTKVVFEEAPAGMAYQFASR